MTDARSLALHSRYITALARAEKAEARYTTLREYLTGHVRERKADEAHVAELLRQRDAASDEVADLTAKLDEARGVLRDCEPIVRGAQHRTVRDWPLEKLLARIAAVTTPNVKDDTE